MSSMINKLFLIIFFFLISACSSVPHNTSNSCKIFDERYLWYKHSKKVEQKWGTPIHIQLAIIKMESDFDWLAKPPRQKLFKVIPFKRPSSSFGYSQAVKGTWEQYKNDVKILFFYLFFISIFLELCHILIPQRSFEFKDLTGNFLGVFIVFIIFYLYYFIKRNR